MEQLRGAHLYSHPQALAQCKSFVSRWRLQPKECSSTAEALKIVATSKDPAVALAAADIDLTGLGLKVGEREVDDLAGSITRFLIVGMPDAFGEFSAEFLPTTRAIWLGKASALAATGTDWLASADANYDEVLRDAAGNLVLITSRQVSGGLAGLRPLGASPWSPRTPVVRVSA
jgi:hypothetical protein